MVAIRKLPEMMGFAMRKKCSPACPFLTVGRTDATLPIINGMHKSGMQFEIITKRQVQNWGHLSDEHLISFYEGWRHKLVRPSGDRIVEAPATAPFATLGAAVAKR